MTAMSSMETQERQGTIVDKSNTVVYWGPNALNIGILLQIVPGVIARCAYFSFKPLTPIFKNYLIWEFSADEFRDFCTKLKECTYGVLEIYSSSKRLIFNDLQVFTDENTEPVFCTVPLFDTSPMALSSIMSFITDANVFVSSLIFGNAYVTLLKDNEDIKALKYYMHLPAEHKLILNGEEIKNKCNLCKHQAHKGDTICINYDIDYKCFFTLNPISKEEINKDIQQLYANTSISGLDIDSNEFPILQKFKSNKDFEEWYTNTYLKDEPVEKENV